MKSVEVRVSKCFFVFLILLAAGTVFGDIALQSSSWTDRLDEKLATIKCRHQDYLNIVNNAEYRRVTARLDFTLNHTLSFIERIGAYKSACDEIDPVIRQMMDRRCVLTGEISEAVFDLWSLTGHCLFSDIPRDQIIENTAIILKRYQQFRADHAKETFPELKLKSIQACIETFKTDYCYEALFILQDQVQFSNTLMSCPSPFQNHRSILPERRMQAYAAMNDWWNRNHDDLQWNPVFQIYSLWNKPFNMAPEDDMVQAVKDYEKSKEIPEVVVDLVFFENQEQRQ